MMAQMPTELSCPQGASFQLSPSTVLSARARKDGSNTALHGQQLTPDETALTECAYSKLMGANSPHNHFNPPPPPLASSGWKTFIL